MAAPLQGLTDAPFRHWHSRLAGGVSVYFTPFIRWERGDVRPRDIRDISSSLQAAEPLVPQIIFRDFKEFEALSAKIIERGFNHIDLNLGCPFPPQVHKGRGAGVLHSLPVLSDIRSWAIDHPDIHLSAKMRLGVTSPDEWAEALPILDAMPLSHLTVHPRTAAMQYSGPLLIDQFTAIVSSTCHKVIFNGEILAPADIDRLCASCPGIAGVMAGRGLLSRPTLFSEWRAGREFPLQDRLKSFLDIHRHLLDHYADTLCGETQIISRLSPCWEYAPSEFPRREVKRLRKASTLPHYHEALTALAASL